jgi:hypothetical protein
MYGYFKFFLVAFCNKGGMTTQVLQEVDLPSLVATRGREAFITVEDNAMLLTINLPSLDTVGQGLAIDSNAALSSVNLKAKKSAYFVPFF